MTDPIPFLPPSHRSRGIKGLGLEKSKVKIKEEIKKSGEFWLPTIPDRKVQGTLSISPSGDIELEILKSLEPNIEAFSRNMDGFNRVVGDVQEYGYVTLDGCQYKTKTRSLSVGQDLLNAHSVLWVNRVFTGVAYAENEVPRFNTFVFSIEGLDEWVAMDAINYEHKEEIKIVAYKPTHSISFNLANGMQLEIISSVVHNTSLSPREEKITRETYFKLVSKKDQELNEFISIVQKLTHLLRFATNETVSLDSMSAISDSHVENAGGVIMPIEINIYSQSGFYLKNPPQVHWTDMLFRFSDIHSNAERVINKWIESYKQYEDAFNLYFLAQLKLQPSNTTKFLTLAQCLEVYHRKTYDDKYMEDDEFRKLRKGLIKQVPKSDRNWFGQRLKFAHELTLKDRIRKIVEPYEGFIGEENVSQLIDYIVDSRHYYTHYNPDLELKAAKGQNLYILCLKMEMLFELCFLELMGFGEEKINSIKRLREKCELPFSDA